MMTKDDRNRLTVRVTKPLDIRLTRRAKKMGVSKNALILILLAKALDDDEEARTG